MKSNETIAERKARQTRESRARRKAGLPARRKGSAPAGPDSVLAKARAEIAMGRLPALPPAVRFMVGRREVIIAGKQHHLSLSPKTHGDLVMQDCPIGGTPVSFGFFVKDKTYLWLD